MEAGGHGGDGGHGALKLDGAESGGVAEDGEATNLAMKLPYRQGEGRIVEDGAVCPVMERMRELEAAASAV